MLSTTKTVFISGSIPGTSACRRHMRLYIVVWSALLTGGNHLRKAMVVRCVILSNAFSLASNRMSPSGWRYGLGGPVDGEDLRAGEGEIRERPPWRG
ncbi:hypothetical protein CENSYa_1083 [Cenarchaeum symbiosum A]|uniref:Uncharacterized protein n=1 Tax=Cenarchaeum symbiosum (strain A) TaxID=414004 RepID=A0RWJ5_CENSY|nr:hypothetical protein CENSYa_1083 [Cenarchaeum symbiosum A]